MLALGLILSISYNNLLQGQLDTMQNEIKDLRKRDSKSYVVERISKQMEDIAYQQKDISDQQREEAVFQMGVAEKMRARAEIEENKARTEQRKAEQYALNLEEARNMAEGQRVLAVQQQRLAEAAKNVADTLSYISLARSLASNSVMQYEIGNFDISGLLAYVSWAITSRYNGNVFYPALFDALCKNSESFQSRKIHKGGVTKVLPYKVLDTYSNYISVSKYGEICQWFYKQEKLEYKTLVSDPSYSFRDAYIDSTHVIYALSYFGELVIKHENKPIQLVELPFKEGWMKICPFNDQTLMLISSTNLCLFDKGRAQITKQISLPQPFASVGEKEGKWLIFGAKNGAWEVSDQGDLIRHENQIGEVVSAYAWSPDLKKAVVGVEDGDIYMIDEKGNVLGKFEGHRSKITQLTFNDNYLFSSSYDCNINIWDLSASKKEPLPLMSLPSWIYTFYLAPNNTVLLGDESGAISHIKYSPDAMAGLVRYNLKRDFTDDEWNYYIGNNIPRVKLKIIK